MANLKIKLYADGADINQFRNLYEGKIVKGFTTNPTLMRKAGVKDYKAFAHELLDMITDLPISFEVFSDDFDQMEKEAREINSWGSNVYIKIPVTNTKGDFTGTLIKKLAGEGLKLNVTAVFTIQQVEQINEVLNKDVPAVVSIFAGRIADTGIDPLPVMKNAIGILNSKPRTELLWASSRELFNIFQAEEAGFHIITVTPEILKKMNMVGMDLDELSLQTVKMFYNDAMNAGFKII